MFFFILQSLFWFLLALFAGYFIGRWLKRLLCNCNVSVNNVTETDYPINTRSHLKTPTKTDIKPAIKPTISTDNSYDAMINKLSSKDKDTPPRSSLNVANISTGAAAATLGTAAYAALKGTDNHNEKTNDNKAILDEKLKNSKAVFDEKIKAEETEDKIKNPPKIDNTDNIDTSPDKSKSLGQRLMEGKATLDEKAKDSKATISEKIKGGKAALDEKAKDSKATISKKLKEGKATLDEKAKDSKATMGVLAAGMTGAVASSIKAKPTTSMETEDTKDKRKDIPKIDNTNNTDASPDKSKSLGQRLMEGRATLDEKLKDSKATISEKLKDGKAALDEKTKDSKATISEKLKDGKTALSEKMKTSETTLGEKIKDSKATMGALAAGMTGAVASSIKAKDSKATISEKLKDGKVVLDEKAPTDDHIANNTTIKPETLKTKSDTGNDAMNTSAKSKTVTGITIAGMATAASAAITASKSEPSSTIDTKIIEPATTTKETSNQTHASHSKDDLTRVMGIGTKIITLLNDADIYTFQALSNTSVEALQKILDDAGDNFRIANPETWPEQASLAEKQEWEQLKRYSHKPK